MYAVWLLCVLICVVTCIFLVRWPWVFWKAPWNKMHYYYYYYYYYKRRFVNFFSVPNCKALRAMEELFEEEEQTSHSTVPKQVDLEVQIYSSLRWPCTLVVGKERQSAPAVCFSRGVFVCSGIFHSYRAGVLHSGIHNQPGEITDPPRKSRHACFSAQELLEMFEC